MEAFVLPESTRVDMVIAKNKFDDYANAKQKRFFRELVQRITWTHKLSTDTVNLPGDKVGEIQVFRIELKAKQDIRSVLDVIDKAIPYQIIFIIEFQDSFYISTSVKHAHPLGNNNSVIDWSFKTIWLNAEKNQYQLNLKVSLDSVYKDFCSQISEESKSSGLSLEQIVSSDKEIKALRKEIEKVKRDVYACKQFNRKVKLNLKLKAAERRLNELLLPRTDSEDLI